MASRSNSCKLFLIILQFLLYPALAPAVTPPIPAQPTQYVVDLAGVLDANAQARLNAALGELEAQTTAQMVVLTVNSLEGEPIESFSHETAVKWRIGQKGKDNGVLLTVAVKDHKYRIEVGYGLEETLPDSLVGSIGRRYLVPNFRKSNFAGGIVAAVNEVAKTISDGKVGVKAGEGTPPYHWETVPKKGGGGSISLTLILLFIFIVLVIINIFRRIFWGGGGGFWYFGGGGSSSSSWGSSDSSGFSGGGGDFGGGGASGDW